MRYIVTAESKSLFNYGIRTEKIFRPTQPWTFRGAEIRKIRTAMWAWVWDSRNKGPVAGRTSDIRNETPGPLVRNESGDRNLDFEPEIKVYFRGRRIPTPDG